MSTLNIENLQIYKKDTVHVDLSKKGKNENDLRQNTTPQKEKNDTTRKKTSNNC